MGTSGCVCETLPMPLVEGAALATGYKDLDSQARSKATKEEVVVRKWYERYDVSRTGTLQVAEVRTLLQEMDSTRPLFDDYLATLMRVYGERVDTDGNGVLDTDGVPRARALPLVLQYKRHVKWTDEVDALLGELAWGRDGKLDPEKLKGLLEQVCPERYVSDASALQFRFAVQNAEGDLHRADLLPALVLWREAWEDQDPVEDFRRMIRFAFCCQRRQQKQ